MTQMEMHYFLRNLYFSQVDRKLQIHIKITVGAIYTVEICPMSPFYQLLVHHGSGLRGEGVHNGPHESGVCGSSCDGQC